MKKTIQEKVKYILEKSERSRNSDVELYILYLQTYVCKTYEERVIMRNVIERASINIAGLTRQRAHIQNKLWLFKSDKQVEEARKKLEEEKRLEFSPSNPSNF